MVSQAAISTGQQSALLRALSRAKAERIVVFRIDTFTLGVATVANGWQERPYRIRIDGTRTQDCHCECEAANKRLICKHLASALFARKHHVYAQKPKSDAPGKCPKCGMDIHDPLHDAFCN
jgi:hypothetical protein